MLVEPTTLPGLLVVTPAIHVDERGFFFESWNEEHFNGAVGEAVHFVQDNQSRSVKNVLRGIHFQMPYSQGKLVRVTVGSIWDVAVDLRVDSETFGHWHGLELTAESHQQLWIPGGFGHGFVVISDEADVAYKVTNYYEPTAERSVRFDDPDLAIDWPVANPRLSEKDEQAPWLEAALVTDDPQA
ncbi:MAG: dTDP-4-dehydrorhamnose 3,5-epimerase [Acidimicrobiia bacterium]|nr:dTDP-4-dehydrorhamnose 3,5-epimerase [Acidimicrobiia bacterium]